MRNVATINKSSYETGTIRHMIFFHENFITETKKKNCKGSDIATKF